MHSHSHAVKTTNLRCLTNRKTLMRKQSEGVLFYNHSLSPFLQNGLADSVWFSFFAIVDSVAVLLKAGLTGAYAE